MNNIERVYRYMGYPVNLYTTDNDPLPGFPDGVYAFEFQATTDEARGQFFRRGFHFDTEYLYDDDGVRRTFQVFRAGEDGVPNRLAAFLHEDESPYQTMLPPVSVEDIRFDQFVILRELVQTGGRKSRRRTRRRTQRKR